MKIIHVGGYMPLVEALAEYQRRLGNDVKVFADRAMARLCAPHLSAAVCERADEAFEGNEFNVLHLHGSTTSDQNQVGSLLHRARSGGARLVISPWDLPSQAPGEDILALVGDNPCHIFVPSADFYDRIPDGRAWSWLATGVELSAARAEPWVEVPGKALTILYAPFGAAQGERDFVRQTFDAIRARGMRFSVVEPPSDEQIDLVRLRELIKKSDLILERVDTLSYGMVAIDALAHGRAVLSGNSKESHELWAEMAMCPVLDTTGQTLQRRLEAVLREPRCLRDLSRRSRAYAAHHHNLETIAKRAVQQYQALMTNEPQERAVVVH